MSRWHGRTESIAFIGPMRMYIPPRHKVTNKPCYLPCELTASFEAFLDVTVETSLDEARFTIVDATGETGVRMISWTRMKFLESVYSDSNAIKVTLETGPRDPWIGRGTLICNITRSRTVRIGTVQWITEFQEIVDSVSTEGMGSSEASSTITNETLVDGSTAYGAGTREPEGYF